MRSVALLSEFGLGHVLQYAPFALILSALHLILRAKSQHILANVREWHFVQHPHFANLQKITFVGPLKMVDKPRGRIHHSEYIVCWFRLVGFGLFGGSCHGVNTAGHRFRFIAQ